MMPRSLIYETIAQDGPLSMAQLSARTGWHLPRVRYHLGLHSDIFGSYCDSNGERVYHLREEATDA